MKLVEILARELEVWPEWAFELYQDPFGKVEGNSYLADKMESLGKFTVAEDHALSIIGKPEWQAERDRMKAMGTFDKQALHDELRSRQGKRMPMPDCVEPEEPTYEQQLWDRVAIQQLDKLTVGQEDAFDNLVKYAANRADAFMAERAKRIKGGA